MRRSSYSESPSFRNFLAALHLASQPVDLAFALFAPEDAGVDHLKALALVSRTLRDTALCSKLRANPEPAKLYALLTTDHSVQAA